MLRSSGVPTVTETPPFSEAPHDTSVDMLAALAATTSALSFILQNGYTKAHWKLRLTSFKTADEKNPIGDIVYRWESEFEVSGQEMSVAVIVNEGMTTGYPLYIWAMGHQSRSMGSDCQLLINLKDPDDIMNWSAEWFKHELQNSHFYTPPNYISIMQKIETVLCLEPGNVHQIDAYYSAFSTAMQEIRMYGLMGENHSLSGSTMDCLRFYSKTWRCMIRSTSTLQTSVMTILRCRKRSETLNNGACLLMHSRN